MSGLRQKLLLAFAGLFFFLVLVAGVGLAVIERVTLSFDRIFRENLTSIQACRQMAEDAEEINQILMAKLWEGLEADSVAILSRTADFDRHIRFQQGNITLPGEKQITDSLAEVWEDFRSSSLRLLNSEDQPPILKGAYRLEVRPLFHAIKQHTLAIAELNSQNILSADGQVRAQARATRRTMVLLLSSAGAFVLLLLFLLGKVILKPIQSLTRSAQEIEKGNLDLTLKTGSRDELGQLAEAFNTMAARLREFRRADRAKLERIQGTTQIAINSLPDAVAVLGKDGMVEMSNAAAERLFGIKPGFHAHRLGLPWLGPLFEKARGGKLPLHPHSYESALQIFQEGKERFFLPHAIPIPDEFGSLSGMTLVLADVTELRRLDETKSDLLSTVSHELKTRLTSIRMAVHLLMDEKVGSLNERQSDLLTAAREDSEHLYHIIESLLDIGRIRAGRLLMDLQPLDAKKTVLKAAEGFRKAFQEKGVRLVIHLPEILPGIIADEARAPLVFSNLLANALKFTDAGGEVEIRAEVETDRVRFRVRDTGIGILLEEQPRIFERFYRGTRGNEPGGAGLGLAIAKEIVEAHGGTLQVVSRAGAGSTFSFDFKRTAN